MPDIVFQTPGWWLSQGSKVYLITKDFQCLSNNKGEASSGLVALSLN